MKDLSLIGQLAVILGVLFVILAIALLNQALKRRAAVFKLVELGHVPPSARRTNEQQLIIGSIPDWIASKAKNTQYELLLSDIVTWLDYARGNLLLATTGCLVALLGVLLIASGLALFAVVGAAVMVVGFQMMYAAAQDAGVFGASANQPAAEESSTRKSKPPRVAESTELKTPIQKSE